MNDPFGLAISDFYKNGKASNLVVNSNYTEDEEIPVAYLFREESKMPEIERIALELCKGNTLDVGAAAGCHSVVLQKKGIKVTALEVSNKAIEVLKSRGLDKVVCSDILNFKQQKFDTILMLMNGAGIGGTLNGLRILLSHLKALLNKRGQILIDSSDIKYLFEEEDGSIWIDLANDKYYGEMEYEVKYKNTASRFKWLFVDFQKLKEISALASLKCELIKKGQHFDYLARLTI